jgi:beta-N-acetylhexosaminidase
MGPVMIGVQGLQLSAEELDMLQHPLVGGVILFSRNYQSLGQLQRLTQTIHDARRPELLIAVDHEGGRVQRFREEFTRLPPLRRFGQIYNEHQQRARQLARTSGWLMAAELRAAGVDFSFAPVLDLDRGINTAIGDRALHHDPQVVIDLAGHYLAGMREAGMFGVGKHFPGHGGVVADSHIQLPVDERSYDAIAASDLLPFIAMIESGIGAMMPAHVVYPQIDAQPAGFSEYWLKTILRRQLRFGGAVFSDDLAMAGAAQAGGPLDRAQAALQAGCDIVLSCNDPDASAAILDGLSVSRHYSSYHLSLNRYEQPCRKLSELYTDRKWQQAKRLIGACNEYSS